MLGHHVKYLQRVRIGPIRLTNLKVGEWRHLSVSEVKLLQALIAPREAKRSTKDTKRTKSARGALNRRNTQSVRSATRAR
jgi:hypothetical protein